MAMNSVSIYTDGSCNAALQKGAWAAILLCGADKTTLYGSEETTSHQRMELIAVIEALKHLDKQETKPSVTLFTDSQYVAGLPARMKRLLDSNYVTKSNQILVNADLLRILYVYFEKLNPQIVKLKSHQNTSDHEQLNGEVDRLCRKIMRGTVAAK